MNRPAVISVAPHPSGGLRVLARFACGCEQMNWFPHAPKRASHQELRGWLFGSNQDEMCSRCRREQANTEWRQNWEYIA